MQNNILIVDDEEDLLELLQYNMEKEGYKIMCAMTGEEALEKIGALPPDLIVLDLMLPGIDGMKVAVHLKKDSETCDIPIIMLTAKGDTESIVNGFKAGAVDYITKPFNISELSVRVRKHLEIKMIRDNLKNSEKELLESNSAKDKFFSIVAHELINPFNALCGYTKLLMSYYDNFSEKEKKGFIQDIYQASNRGMDTLNNLLDWSRMQADRISFKPEQTDLEALILENLYLLKPSADQKKIELSESVCPGTNVHADPDMIRIVIRNLISNAIKFTPEGGKIEVTSEHIGDYEEITVSDTGIGIKNESLEKLFRIDTYHSTLGTANEKGSGFGLILCKEFIEKNKGQIWIESVVGKGTNVKFTLPKMNGIRC